MGIFDEFKKAAVTVADEVKGAATTVGTEAGKAGRVGQAQMKLRSLQGDQAKAEKELGQATYDLIEAGSVQAPALDGAMAKTREARAAVAAKEAEIEAIKAEAAKSDSASPAAESTAAPETATSETPAAGSGVVTPAGPSTERPGT